MHLAPDGFRLRLMEPGEAEGLLALGAAAGLFRSGMPDRDGFVRWLLRHEVFVAEDEVGGLAGFAAARDAVDLYWIAGLAVAPLARGRGVRKGLLGAATARAGWFFHRAVALAAAPGEEADWYRRRRFLAAAGEAITPALAALLAERPGFPPGEPAAFAGDGEVSREALLGSERTLMVQWL